ncbi:MAG: ribonuclease Y [Clostridiales bacterium]|nr:ribonuclease Y [Clostridiales bacterium]
MPVIAIVCAGVGVLVGIYVYRSYRNRKIGSTQAQADSILDFAREEAKSLKKEAINEAREENQRLKNETERQFRERNSELSKQENRMNQKEEALDKKEELLLKKLDQIDVQQKQLITQQGELNKRQQELDKSEQKIQQELERVAGMTQEEAKQVLVESMVADARKDAAGLVRKIEAEAKASGEQKAREIVATAIQRCASDQVSEMTVTTVPLPSDEMKGRLIGREGRNIRALENATGVELIIDDTPEVVILSGFDPVRRQIARITIEKLIADGRIHPARIEEMVEKVKRDMDVTIKDEGEAASFDTGVFGLHPEIIKLLGRLKFRTSYGQNVLRHSIEVSYIAGIMASELGLDVALAKRGALLHDIGKAVDQEIEGTHMQIGADLAKKYKESKEVVNCIASHHGDVEPMTVEAVIVAAADAVSGARPGARRESLENYVKRLEKLEEIANSFKGVQKSYAVQAGREIRIIVKPEEVNDETTVLLANDIARRIESELEYPGQIKVNVIRETRSVDFAK